MRVPKFQTKRIELSSSDVVKLENLAKHFEIKIDKKESVVYMEVYNDGQLQEKITVSTEKYPYRLFSELCSKTIVFLKFVPSKCLKATLFSDTTENKLPKIIALYQKHLNEPYDLED